MQVNQYKIAAWVAILIGCFLHTNPVNANAPTLVRDINTQPIGMSSNSTFLGALNGWTYLAATDGLHGSELWKTDGTTAGTAMVKDIEPGAGSSNPASFVTIGAVAYFTATTQGSGTRIWITDGTANGTRQVDDLPSSAHIFSPAVVGALGTKAIVASDDGASGATSGTYLWANDGTPNGTVRLAQIIFTPSKRTNGFTTASNGKAYFAGFDSVHGMQPWVTDGTVAGTRLVAELSPGNIGSSVASFVQVGSYVYFLGATPPASYELYRIRLSDDGVEKISSNITIVDYSTGDLPLIPFGNRVLFIALDFGVEQVWISDGSPTGTIPLANHSSQYGNSYLPPRFTVVGNRAMFATVLPGFLPTVFSTDGTVTGTIDLSAAASSGGPTIAVTSLGTAGGFAYYGSNGTYGFRTDGTLAGTSVISTPMDTLGVVNFTGDASAVYFKLVGIAPQGSIAEYWLVKYNPASNTSTLLERTPLPSGQPVQASQLFALSGGHLYFDVETATRGLEPWVSDGTVVGTQLLADIAPETTNGASNPTSFFNFQGTLYFSANDGLSGEELWKSDGTAGGTQMVADLVSGPVGSAPLGLFTAGNSLMFFARNGTGSVPYLWRFDAANGTANNFPAVGNPYTCPRFTTASASGLTYFPAFGDGVEPWRTDGTTVGTIELADVAQGGGSSNPCTFVSLGGKAYFIAQQVGDKGYSVFATGGVSAAAEPIAALGNLTNVPSNFLAVYAGALYFSGSDTSNRLMLWRSDGTASGTVAIAPLPATISSFIGVVNNRLLFAGTPYGANPAFWVFDATTSAFTAITNLIYYGSGPLTGNGALAFFTGFDKNHSLGPWVTDGTAEGTVPLPMAQGYTYSGVQWLGDFHNQAIYVTTDNSNARSYWKSDGTVPGTVSLGPLSSGQSVAASNPMSATVDDKFFFAVNDPTIGTELYVLVADAPNLETTTTLTTKTPSAATGATIELTATVTSSTATSVPTGKVSFTDGTTQLGTAELSASGIASFATATLSVGVHSINASYDGDQRYRSSMAPTLTVTVTAPLPTVTLSASASTVVVGKSVTLTWSSTNVTSCIASGDWSGTEPVMGAQVESPRTAGTVSYTLTCTGSSGSASTTQRLTVTDAPTSGGGGGGALAAWELFGMACLLLPRMRRGLRGISRIIRGPGGNDIDGLSGNRDSND